VATECSWNDGSKAQYYIVILDRLLGRSGGLERAPEWRVRGPLTVRVFLEVAGTVQNWIKSFAEVSNPLTKLTRVTKSEFKWGEKQRLAMEKMKKRVSTCAAI